jgi:predicted DNA-binding transcriptional regulator AlpA
MTTAIQNRRVLLTEAAAAERLGIKPSTLTVWRSTRRYDLPYVKVGRSVRYTEDAIEQFIVGRTIGATASE